MRPFRHILAMLASIVALASAHAEDTLKVAIGARYNWDPSVCELGQNAGIFKKYGLTLDIFYTAGSGETMQAVISGSADLALAVGIMGAMGAYAKGAPIRAVGSEINSSAEYWYVKASSPIHSLKDTDGKTIAYSTFGAATHQQLLALIKAYGLNVKMVATGSHPATMTQVMTDQVDIGWASAPNGLEAVDEGKIRILMRGSDLESVRDETGRVLLANLNVLQQRKNVIARFVQAYRDTVDWMYADPKALAAYAELAKIPPALAKRTRDEFFPKSMLWPDKILGIQNVMADAVELKYLTAPLTEPQLKDFFQIPPPLAAK